MPKKRVLIFIDWFLPGYKAGGPISSNANLVDHLSKEFEFYIITRNTDYCETNPYPSVTSDAWNTLSSGARIYYMSQKQLSFTSLARVCRSVDFEVVFINGIYSLYFSIFPLLWFKYFKRKKVVVSARGMLSDHTFSSKRLKKKLFYFVARATKLYEGITIHATNENEAIQIRKNVGFKGDINVAPNLPPKTIHPVIGRRTKIPGELRLVSIARISPEKNTIFMAEVLLKLSQNLRTVPPPLPPFQIILDLYGTIYDELYWKQCEEIIDKLPINIKVHYCGPVEKPRINEMLSRYHFLFMPSQGENYGHSIIESLIAGCPVIISDRTPWRKLDKVAGKKTTEDRPQTNDERREARDIRRETRDQRNGVGWDLPLDQPERFVEIIEQCAAMNQEEYDAMSRRAFGYAQEVTNNPEVLEENRRLFD